MLALAQDRALEGLADPNVLELAASEGRVLITRNSRDFAPLAREWAEAQRSHAGLILIWTLDHGQFTEIVAGVEQQLQRWPSQEQWLDDRDLLRGRPRVLWAIARTRASACCVADERRIGATFGIEIDAHGLASWPAGNAIPLVSSVVGLAVAWFGHDRGDARPRPRACPDASVGRQDHRDRAEGQPGVVTEACSPWESVSRPRTRRSRALGCPGC